ncbi:MAG: CBS domain-containing protein [Methanotrichaceae archaeon]|nr:CBS domain-containing protein [Methanotrichaceae archaeon]
MNSSLELGKIMGIPIRLHWTFLFIIVVVTWNFASFSQEAGGIIYGFGAIEQTSLRWIYSLLFAILLFTCVALHELGHSYIAHKNGISIKSITLYFFGGVASMEEIPRNPRMELQMAFAGPAVSGVIGLATLYLAGPAAAFGGAGSPLTIMLSNLGVMNIILMAFNLLPAFPMDGGRLLRAWFATRMPYVKATRRAADIGKIFATLMFLLGLFTLNFMLLFVAFFVYVGASEEDKATEISVSLEGILVRDIMSSQVRSISPEMTLEELKELMFREKHRGYPVMSGGVLVGIVTLTDLQNVPEARRAQTRVDQMMARKLYMIGPEEEASTAMKKMNDLQIRRLPVIEEGRLVGIVSREDLVRAIELCKEREH